MNNNLYQHFKGYEIFVKQLIEGINRYQKYKINIVFNFIGLDKFRIVETVLNHQVPYKIIKGNYNSLIGRLVIGDGINDFDYICCLHGFISKKYGSIKHTDLLGALKNIGINDDTYGDIWVDDEDFYIICEKEISSFLINNLITISRYKISLEELNYIPVHNITFKTMTIITSSYRLDNIVSEIINCSRNKAQELIKSGKINIDFKIIDDCSLIIYEENIISIRGYGRFKVGKTTKKTKSDNFVLEIFKYLN